MNTPFYRRRLAFTLVELLVTIAIIGILIGLLAPALQGMRESVRRTQCQANLNTIGWALQNYHDRWDQFPIGTIAESTPVRSEAKGLHHNWLGRLSDLLDQPVIARKIDRSISVYESPNTTLLQLNLPVVQCPSSRAITDGFSSYVGLHHVKESPITESDSGAFVLNTVVTRDDVRDGLTNTAFVSEKWSSVTDLGWLSGTRATLRNVAGGIQTNSTFTPPTDPLVVGGIGSRHAGGAHVLFGDGAVRFQTAQIEQQVLVQMVDRDDGQIPMLFQSIDEQRKRSLQ
ncbi:MAG: DUF1559 domain-containing protein [Planctomycetota bacterium]